MGMENVAQVEVATRRIHELTARNAALRDETAALRHQLARHAIRRILASRP